MKWLNNKYIQVFDGNYVLTQYKIIDTTTSYLKLYDGKNDYKCDITNINNLKNITLCPYVVDHIHYPYNRSKPLKSLKLIQIKTINDNNDFNYDLNLLNSVNYHGFNNVNKSYQNIKIPCIKFVQWPANVIVVPGMSLKVNIQYNKNIIYNTFDIFIIYTQMI